MMKKLIRVALAATLALSMALAGCGSSKSTDDKAAATAKAGKEVKVGFIYVGPQKDGGWSEAHDNGRLFLEKELGVKTLFRELVPEGPEAKKAIKDLIDQGCNVIFSTSFGFMDPTEEVAKEFPDVYFFHCSGYKAGTNFANYFGKMYEGRYLSGIVAGLKTKSNKLGYVAAFEIPEVINGINAYTLGAQSVNPNVQVIVKWSHTWIDEAKEKEAGIALLDEGCDVIAQHNDSTAPQKAAEQRGAFAVGYDLDTPQAAPKAYMTAPVWNWGPYYVNTVKAIKDGTYKVANYYGSMADGNVALAPLTSVAPADAKGKIDALIPKIKDGSFKVFAGPLLDQTGKERLAKDKVLEEKDILAMDWFVKGVVGKIETAK